MQFAYNATRAKQGTRAAAWVNPKQGELLIATREEALKHIADFEKSLEAQMPRHKRAELLIARAMIYEAIGTPKMLDAAQDAYKFTKTSTTCHLLAVAYHHFGNIKEAVKYYEQAYRYPHEAGFNIDLAYTQALLFQDKWAEAHKMTLGLKKRMVYAAYLPEWDGKGKELSIISEGGFGDIIHTGRWIPILRNMGIHVTIYLPPYFFEHGFVDLMKCQSWCPDVKLLTDTPMKVPAVGFFDLPAVFNVMPDSIPEYPGIWKVDLELIKKFSYIRKTDKLNIGFCWAARQQETPLVPDGIYRALTEEQAQKIISETGDRINWISLQHNTPNNLGICAPELKSWMDTAAIIENLDAVITVDTAVAHLSAVMNKPTWVMLSGALDWKFGMSGEKCIWYSTMKLFRNEDFGFENTIKNVIQAITDGELNIV